MPLEERDDSSDSSSREEQSVEESEEDEFVDPTQLINDDKMSQAGKALEAAAFRACTPPPPSPMARPPSRGKGYLGLGMSPHIGKGPRKEPRVEEADEEEAFVPIQAPPAPHAAAAARAPVTDLVIAPSAKMQLPRTFDEMEEFAMQLQARSLMRTQLMIDNATTQLIEFNKATEQRMMHNLNAVGRQVQELKQQFADQVDRVEAMKALETRAVVEFLIRFGMDTRNGYVCGLPMHVKGELYMLVCIPLLGYAMRRLFPALIKKHNLTIPNISKIMSRLDPVTLTFDKDVQREVLMGQMAKVFAVREYAASARVGDTWAVFTVEQFLRVLRDLRRQNQTLDPSAMTPYDKIKYTSGERVQISQESATSSKLRNKMAWAKEVQQEVLALPSMKEFFGKLYEHRGEEAPDLSRPFHFCGDVPDFQKPVRCHAALRDAWRREEERGGAKKRRPAQSESSSAEEDDNDDSEKEAASSEDEPTEEQVGDRRSRAVVEKRAAPKRKQVDRPVTSAKRAFIAQKAAAYRAAKRAPTGDDDSEVLA
jgi:hypothetical protein